MHGRGFLSDRLFFFVFGLKNHKLSFSCYLSFSVSTMDLNASPVSVSASDSRPISLSPVMVTAGAAPATVEIKDRDSLEKKRERSRMYDSKGKSTEPSERPEESARLRMRKGKELNSRNGTIKLYR